jgi:hypothetical protein
VLDVLEGRQVASADALQSYRDAHAQLQPGRVTPLAHARLSELVRVVKYLPGSVVLLDALPYLGARLPVVAVGDEMVDWSFRWSDCGRSVFRGPPRGAWVPRALRELAACLGRIVDVWAWSERWSGEGSGGSSAAGPSALSR